MNGIFWVLRSGAPWRDLPNAFGPDTACYNRFVRWRRAGVSSRIMDALCFSPYLYRARNLVERFFNKIKQCRRVATRYDKLAANYLAFIQLAAMRLWLRVDEYALRASCLARQGNADVSTADGPAVRPRLVQSPSPDGLAPPDSHSRLLADEKTTHGPTPRGPRRFP